MRNTCTLLNLELRSFYGINKFQHTKDKKEKNRCKALLLVWILLILVVFCYVGGLVYCLCSLGLSEIVPAYLVTVSSLIVFMFGIFKAGNRIFGQRGYDILVSMPIKPGSIVVSRFLGLYIEDLTFSLGIMLPGIITYCVTIKPPISFYFTSIISSLFIPAIPLVASTIVGTLIFSISSRLKGKNIVQTILMVIFVIAIVIGSFSFGNVAEGITLNQVTQLAVVIGNVIGKIYPPAMWLNEALINSSLLNLLMFAVLSVVIAVLTVYIVSIRFNSIIRKLLNSSAKHNYKMKDLQSKGILKSLYFREAKRYISSSIYVTNTIVGPILATLMAVAISITGTDVITSSIPNPINIARLIPYLFSAVSCMMTTTSVSLSMEGKQFWIVKSLPIPTKTLLDSKILLNLSIMLPSYIISEIAFTISIKPNLLELLWQVLIPASLMIFVTVFGISVNLKFHSFDWEKEETVVKQSLPAMLGGFAGFFLSIMFAIVIFIVPNRFSDIVSLAIFIIVVVSTLMLYNRNNKKNLEAL